MKETHTIATFEVDADQLRQMTFSPKRLMSTRYMRDKKTRQVIVDEDGNKVPNPHGTLTKIMEWIRSEDPSGFDEENMHLGTDDDPWYFSYYQSGMLYRLMKDGRVKMESADATDMMSAQYEEFKKLVNMLMIDELTNRMLVAMRPTLKEGRLGIKRASVSGMDSNRMYTQRNLFIG